MILENKIKAEINNHFAVIEFTLENESYMHSGEVPESHFKMVLVSDDFIGLNKVKRHQAVYKVLKEIMPLFHALDLHTFSNEEWLNSDCNLNSPNCLGGGK